MASADALSKKALTENNEYLVAWVRFGFATPFLLFLLLFIDIPKMDMYFFLSILTLLPLEILAITLYMKAIKASPLSLTLPFLALSPVFMIFTSSIMLGERPDRYGIMGILLTATGAYMLHANTTRYGLLEPFRAIMQEKGSVYMIIVAFIFSITSNLGKLAVIHSSPLFFTAVYFPLLALAIFPMCLWKNYGKIKKLILHGKLFGLIGLSMACVSITHYLAINIAAVPYVISLKRTSLLIGVIYGAIWFKETNIKERLIGSIIMTAGVLIITLL